MFVIKAYKKIPLLQKLLFAMILGVVAGIVFGEDVSRIEIIGTVFLKMLKMACIPLIMVNLISGIASLDDPAIFGRVGVKILIYFTITTVVAATLGVIGGTIIRPGDGLVLSEAYSGNLTEVPSLVDTITGMIPDNIFAALSNAKLDQVVVFSAFCGVAVLMCKESDRIKLAAMFNSLSGMFNRLVGIIMGVAPFGIFSLISSVVGKYGKNMAGPAFKYVAAIAVCMLIHWVFYFVVMFVTTGSIPDGFIKKTLPLLATAVSTSSTMASIPINMQCAEDLGCSKSIYSFVVPLGAQLNKDGHAIVLTMSLLFAAQAAGVNLSGATLINAIIIALLLTTGSGGIPGGGLVTIAIIIDAFQMPTEAVAIISGVFFIIDTLNTSVNTYGTLIGTYIIDRAEKKRAEKARIAAAGTTV